MITQKEYASKSFKALDLFVVMTASVIFSWLSYHPYYFGDELTAFFRSNATRTFIAIYDDLNSYKPRLVFNALWAFYGSLDAPRYLPMLVNTFCLGGAASLLYLIALRRFNASRVLSLILAGTLITSRFGAMLYFDYLSGNIETLSLLLFLAGLYYVLESLDNDIYNRSSHLVLASVFTFLSVFVHERYIAATFMLGVSLIITSTFMQPPRRRLIAYGTTIALLPGIAFYLAGKILSSMPISTGTAGREVNLGLGTISSLLSYLANVSLDTNFGLSWFVGTLTINAFPGTFLIPALAILLLASWLLLLSEVKLNDSNRAKTLLILCLTIAMMAVATLPGPSKQESRWMFPVAALMGLFVVSASQRRAAYILLSALLTGNVIYYATGSYRGIFNVQASETAKVFGEAFKKFKEAKGPGVILSSPEPQTSWWLGGDTVLGNDASSGLFFCRTNFRIDAPCIYPPTALNAHHFTYGFKYSQNNDGSPSFTYVTGSTLSALEAIRVAADAGNHTSGLASISASPATIDTCDKPDTKANIAVQWLVKDVHHPSVTVWLVSPNGIPALFASGDAKGTADTGKWVTTKLAFVLTDSKTNEVLAVASVSDKQCPNR